MLLLLPSEQKKKKQLNLILEFDLILPSDTNAKSQFRFSKFLANNTEVDSSLFFVHCCNL